MSDAALVVRLEKQFAGGPRIEADLGMGGEAAPVSVLFGPSGSGKTTVLRCVAGLERPDRGLISCGDETWFDSERRISLSPQQRSVGLLHQDYALFPHLTVEQNVGYGLKGVGQQKRRARVGELIELFGLHGLEQRRPRGLSGGEQQRVALARALAPSPRLLLLDEPLSALDAPTRDRLRGELRRILKMLNTPAIVVTHDRGEALALGDRISVIIAGRVRQTGPVEQIFAQPADLEVARLLGVESVLAGRVVSSGDGTVTVDIEGGRVIAVDPGDVEGDVFVCVRAEDVILLRDTESPHTRYSARNHLAARVTAVQREVPLFRVSLDCGFPLSALITPQALEDLQIEVGVVLTAVIKAPSVHCIPR